METIADKLKSAPKGTKLFSLAVGECSLRGVKQNGEIVVSYPANKEGLKYFSYYDKDGKFSENGEVVLFPSKDVRDWTDYQSNYQFKPFDKVIARAGYKWTPTFFSFYDKDNNTFNCNGISYKECLPYNEETVKLIGN